MNWTAIASIGVTLTVTIVAASFTLNARVSALEARLGTLMDEFRAVRDRLNRFLDDRAGRLEGSRRVE